VDLLYSIFLDPFVQMGAAPDLLVQTLWEGLVAGVLYSLIALGFVLIFKASGVFNFAQGIMMVFAVLTLIGLYEHGVPAFVALGLTLLVMLALAFAVERLVLRPLINQPDIILFMATFGLTYFLIGFGELVFGGDPKVMITDQLLLPRGSYELKMFGGFVQLQKLDIAAVVIASLTVALLALFFQKTWVGLALRAVADSHRAALSVGISLGTGVGGRLVRLRHRRAHDRYHVGGALQCVLRAAGHRAQGAAGADTWRLYFGSGRDRGRHHHWGWRKTWRILLGAAARQRHRELARLCHCARSGRMACSAK
jgi:Branched-chain amino acid transport system / permease component